jgi:hypothetical protein
MLKINSFFLTDFVLHLVIKHLGPNLDPDSATTRKETEDYFYLKVWLDRAERGGKEGEKFSMMTKFLGTAGLLVHLFSD